MFTGIIEGLGTVTRVQPMGQGSRMAIETDFELDGTRIGDSIAVNGACLTAVTLDGRQFSVDVSPETLSRTVLGANRIGDRVNLERALQLSGRLDGHLVSGHVDGIGTIRQRSPQGNAIVITVDVPEPLVRYMIPKGSVAVDGISLTINQAAAASFTVSIIPHTAHLTTIGFKNIGEKVNIETDMIGKYIERFLTHPSDGDAGSETPGSGGVDMELLKKTGFI
jgi:riboflavin synthase